MVGYLIKNILYALLTLFGVVSVVFLLFAVLPGDPARMMLGQNQTPEQLAIVKQKYGFDLPIGKQYIHYLNDLSVVSLHSKNPKEYTYLKEGKYKYTKLFETTSSVLVIKAPYLRESFQKNSKPVTEIIGETLPNTILLAFAAIIIALIVGLVLGIVSVLTKDSWIDISIQFISTLGMSIPSFFSAVLFAWIFGYVLHEYTNLPLSGSLYEVDDFGEGKYIQWRNLILPAIVLGIRPLAVVSQLMRNSLLEVMNQDYIRTAFAKGLRLPQVLLKHALRNALNPVITALSGWFASMLAGAVFVEYIFGWNGLGKEIVEALNTLDLPVIMGAVLVVATMFIIINILVDSLYAWLDPKIRLY